MVRGAWPTLPQRKIPTEPGLAGANAGGALGLGPLKPAAASLPGWEPQQSSHCLRVSTLAPRSLSWTEKVLCPALVLTDCLFRCFLPLGECCPRQQH